MNSKELREELKSAGCSLARQGKGSHEIWYSPLTKKTFPVPHPKKFLPIGTVKSIKRLAGI